MTCRRNRRAATNSLAVALIAIGACHRAPRVRAPVPPTHPHPDVAGLVRHVDPFIGTDDGDSPDPPPGDSGGAVFPGATVPFGMIQWSPDTGPSAEFGYHYRDDHIRGFSVTHLSGAGCGALTDFPFLPTTGSSRDPVAFRHADELATPGYYKVALANGTEVELTAAPRAAAARFTFAERGGLLIEAGKTIDDDQAEVTDAEIRLVSDTHLTASLTSERFCGHASRYTIHLAVDFDQPMIARDAFTALDVVRGQGSAKGPRTGLWLQFGRLVVNARIAISYVSVKNAEANLAASTAAFDQMRAEATAAWNTALGRVEVRGGTNVQQRTFYTALYHSLLHPNIASDVTGDYTGFDGVVRRATDYTHYATFSGWDIYRSWIQLVTLLYPEVADDIVRSLLASGEQCGALPRWALANDETGVMVGDPGALIVANAYAFGARGFDARRALVLATSPAPTCNQWPARPFAEHVERFGYIPNDPEIWGSAAITLEYAAADHAIAQLARALGDATIADDRERRARVWRNLFDPSTGYIRPRYRTGGWKVPFRATNQRGYIEGNAAQYTFFVPHDPEGLAAALGGRDRVFARLDALFAQLNAGLRFPHFYIGNEPQFGTPYLYARLGALDRTQAIVRRILTRTFTDLPGGLPGNDDLGALSSWYVWSALGLYPDLPGTADLALASPVFPSATLRLRDGSELVIESGGAVVARPSLDGAPLGSSVALDRLLGGHTLRFE